MSGDKVSILISRDLYNEVKRRVELSQGEFHSVEDYVEFVLKEVVKKEEEPKQTYSPEEEKKIKKKLRELGYL